MSKDKSYIHLFKSVAEYEEARNNNYYEPWVSYAEGVGGGLAYNKTAIEKPLTIKALESGKFKLNSDMNFLEADLHYSKNGGERTAITSADTINVNAGDVLELYGNNTTFCDDDTSEQAYFSIGFQCNIYGNIMSIFNGDDFKTNLEFTSGYGQQCYQLFVRCKVVDASNLILPATTLSWRCYDGMFLGCTNLVTAPELPATTLEYGCYNGMFYGCTSLTSAPLILPAITLASNCYGGMFQGCTSLTTAPALPATTLAGSCYSSMFADCTSLNYIKCLATNISAIDCTSDWVYGVASNGTFVKNANMSSWATGKNGIPSNWTVQDA